MQKKLFQIRLKALPFLTRLSVIALFGIIYSCNGGRKDTTLCPQLDSATIKRIWVDQGWTSPSSTNHIVELEFITTSAGNGYEIDVEPMKDPQHPVPIPGGKIDLSEERDCFTKMPASIKYVPNYLPFEDLRITLPSGDLINFDFIRLTPVQDYPPSVNYQVDVIEIVDGEEKILTTVKSRPCPPYCPILVQEPQYDSLMMKQRADSIMKQKADSLKK